MRAVRDRDLAALASVSGIGKKKAERIVLELTDRLDDLPAAAAVPQPAAEAVRALVDLGYSSAAAETAVRNAIQDGAPDNTAALIRRALAELGKEVTEMWQTERFPDTAEWQCTRCGSTNRKLVAGQRQRSNGSLRELSRQARAASRRDAGALGSRGGLT